MNELAIYVLKDCYAILFCIVIVLFSLFLNKKCDKKLYLSFGVLLTLVLIEAVCAACEEYFSAFSTYQPGRVLLVWICLVTAPAIKLTIIQISLRKKHNRWRKLVWIPEIINIALCSLAFVTKWVYYFDENNIYHEGPVWFLPYAISILYLVIVVLVSLLNIKEQRQEGIVVIICVAFVLFIGLNEYTNTIPISFSNETVAICVLAYLMYFVALNYHDAMTEMNSSFSVAEQKLTRNMLDQSIETLAYTIDAKDKYTKGHSFRVAKYASMIAKLDGKDEVSCREVYLTGLLHDIGKISISDSIINKDCELTEEEYKKIQSHPAKGALILEKMKSYPYLKDGAKYHHERFDGKGYPFGIKGNDIPEMARIIAVADAYDTMTSYRSYRSSMDQIDVKQELWKGMGTQFDPHFAKLMIALLDADVSYELREKSEEPDEILFDGDERDVTWTCIIPKSQDEDSAMMQETNLEFFGDFICGVEHWVDPTESALVKENGTSIDFICRSLLEEPFIWHSPLAVVFSSKDGSVSGQDYEELGVFLSAGYSWKAGPTIKEDASISLEDANLDWDLWLEKNKKGMKYHFEAIRQRGRVKLKLANELFYVNAELQIPKNYNKKIYISLSGEQCQITDILIK